MLLVLSLAESAVAAEPRLRLTARDADLHAVVAFVGNETSASVVVAGEVAGTVMGVFDDGAEGGLIPGLAAATGMEDRRVEGWHVLVRP